MARHGMLFRLHQTAGVVLAAYVAAVSVSGAALLFRPELQRWISPDLFAASAGPAQVTMGDAARAIAESDPGKTFVGIGAPTPDRAAYLGYLFDETGQTYHAVLADPESGAVLGSPPEDSLVLWLQDLHFNLLGGTTGRVANGVAALALVVMAGTGIALWWPGRWRRWSDPVRSSHALIGAGIAIWILVWGVTGAYFIFPAPFRSASQILSPAPGAQGPASDPAHAPGRPDLDVLVERAEREGGKVSRISIPTEATGTVQAVVNRGAPTPWEGDGHVYYEFDRYTGALLARRPLADRSVGEKILPWFGRVHMGGFGGGPIRWTWASAALGLAFLAVSGVTMWWRRPVTSRRRRASTSPRCEP